MFKLIFGGCPGNLIFIDIDKDYPITFSEGVEEFWYLLNDLADKTLSLAKVESQQHFKIKPEGWERIHFLNKIELADDKYNIESIKINKKINSKEADLIEKASLNNQKRYSSVLARKRKDLLLEGTIEKLEKKIEIDKKVIFEPEIISIHDELKFLTKRIRKSVEFEKNYLKEKLSDVYRNCRTSDAIFKHDIEEVLSDVDSKENEILNSLKIEISSKSESKPSSLSEIDINNLINMEENTQLEFKSSFQWDVKNKCKNKSLKNEVIKTIAAFNNTEGGYLLIGINDNKDIVGLENDYSLSKGKQNKDVFLQTLTHEIESKISKEFVTRVDVQFYNLEGKDICRVKVNFGNEPIFVKEGNDNEVFYIRLQNSTRFLSIRDAVKYIKQKWK